MENKIQYIIMPLAQEDIESIFRYISEELYNYKAAMSLIEEFEKSFDLLCLFPKSCPTANNEFVADSSLRKLIVRNYLVFYTIEDNIIKIVRVLNEMRSYETTM